MRKLLFLLLSAAALSVQAAQVTIDFEEVTPSSGSFTEFESKGYGFLARTDFLQESFTGVSSDGIYASGENAVAGFCDLACQAEIVMERTDGGIFAVFALDSDSYSNGFGAFFGTLAGGSTVALSFSDIGTGDWLNLTRLSYIDNNPFALDKYVHMDNIVAAAVPIPAAVWLFGWALVGLGWLKRKQPV
jgi:hypothetical protein